MSRDTAALTPKGITATTGRSVDKVAAIAAPESIQTAAKSPMNHRSMKPASLLFYLLYHIDFAFDDNEKKIKKRLKPAGSKKPSDETIVPPDGNINPAFYSSSGSSLFKISST